MHLGPKKLSELFFLFFCQLVSGSEHNVKSCGLTFYYLHPILGQGLSEPEFYGHLVYKLRRLLVLIIFQRSSIKLFSIIKKIGYFINVLQQLATLLSSLTAQSRDKMPLYFKTITAE